MGRNDSPISFPKTRRPAVHTAPHSSSVSLSPPVSSDSSVRDSRLVHVPGGISITNLDFENSVQSQPYTAFTFNDIPTTVAPPYNAIDQGYRGDTRNSLSLWNANSPSHSSAYSSNGSFRLDVVLPAQVSGSTPGRYPMDGNPAPPLQDIEFQASSSITPAPLYEDVITPNYEGYTNHASQPYIAEPLNSVYGDSYNSLSACHLTDNIAPQFPSPSMWLTSASGSGLLPNPFAGHNFQAVASPEQGGQQSGVPQISNINIDRDDLQDTGSADDTMTIGHCLRTDSPCGLWVKTDKRSLKRHAQKWHGVSRGGDNIRGPCTWSGCTKVLQKGAVPRHTLRQHFGETFECRGCSRHFTRWNCWRNHARRCKFGSLGYTVSYNLRTRVVNVTDMSLSQGGS